MKVEWRCLQICRASKTLPPWTFVRKLCALLRQVGKPGQKTWDREIRYPQWEGGRWKLLGWWKKKILAQEPWSKSWRATPLPAQTRAGNWRPQIRGVGGGDRGGWLWGAGEEEKDWSFWQSWLCGKLYWELFYSGFWGREDLAINSNKKWNNCY